MTDYNSMKADEYAQQQGAEQELELEIYRISDEISSEIPSWAWDISISELSKIVKIEARRRVMQTIKERGEP